MYRKRQTKFETVYFRQSKNHKTRIVLFVGSPVQDEEKDIVRYVKSFMRNSINRLETYHLKRYYIMLYHTLHSYFPCIFSGAAKN